MRRFFASQLLLAAVLFSDVHADINVYEAQFSAETWSPAGAAVNSNATGPIRVAHDNNLRTLQVAFEYSGLAFPSTVAHIHARPFGSTASPGWPVMINFGTSAWVANQQAGSYARTFDLAKITTYSGVPNFVPTSPNAAALENYLISAITAQNAYLNVHSTLPAPPAVPTGEIWGRTLALATTITVADCPSDLVGGVTGAGEGAVTKVEWKTPSFQKTLPTNSPSLEVQVSNNRDARISDKDGQSTGHFHAGETTVTYYTSTMAPEGRLALCSFKVTVPQQQPQEVIKVYKGTWGPEFRLENVTTGPRVFSNATGSATLTYNSQAHTLLVDFNYVGLLGGPAVAHLHVPTATVPVYVDAQLPAKALPIVIGYTPFGSNANPNPLPRTGSYKREYNLRDSTIYSPFSRVLDFPNEVASPPSPAVIEDYIVKMLDRNSEDIPIFEKAYTNIHTSGGRTGYGEIWTHPELSESYAIELCPYDGFTVETRGAAQSARLTWPKPRFTDGLTGAEIATTVAATNAVSLQSGGNSGNFPLGTTTVTYTGPTGVVLCTFTVTVAPKPASRKLFSRTLNAH